MKISATAALVMNWTDPELWQCKEAQNYLAQLDLSEGDRLYYQFSEWENYMHLHYFSGGIKPYVFWSPSFTTNFRFPDCNTGISST